MDPNFAGKPFSAPYIAARTDLDQMPDTPTRGTRHRRVQSETFFRFPDFDDDMLLDGVVDFNFDNPAAAPPLPQSSDTSVQPANSADSSSTGPGFNPKSHAHFRSLSVDSDFFDGLEFGASSAADVGAATPTLTEKKVVGSGSRHRHSNSMDGSFPTTFEIDSISARKATGADRLAELALIDPKRAKRILANRQSAARSKERKVRYTNELEKKVQTLQTEATTLSAQITLLQRDTSGLTAENKELKLRLQALEQQAHLRDALNETLREELQRLKIEAGEIQAPRGNNFNRGPQPQLPPQPQTFVHRGNHHHQQIQQQQQQQLHMLDSTASRPSLSGQAMPSFQNFSQRAG